MMAELIVVNPPWYGTSTVDADIKFRSDLEFQFAHLWAELYPELDLIYEWKIPNSATGRRKRNRTLDFYHPRSRVGIELNGGVHQPGMGHSTGTGIQRDYHKAQICSARGIRLFPLSADDALCSIKLAAIATAIKN